MEAYSATLNGQVLRFLTSWTRELHTLGYSSGVYSNSLSGIQALVNNYANPADTMPDVIYDALWNGAANTSDPILPGTDWAGHQRIHQYQGGQNATYGGDTVNIDKDYLDVQQGVTGGSPAGLPGGRPVGRGRGRVLQGSGRQAVARLVRARQRLARPGQPGRLAGDPAVRGRVGARQRGRVRQGHERPPAGGLLRARDELVRGCGS